MSILTQFSASDAASDVRETLNANLVTSRSAQPRFQPVATGTNFPFNASFGTAGFQGMFRTVHYFPKGSWRTRFYFSGAYANAIERDGTTTGVLKAAAYAIPAPWDATKTYQIGDQVTTYALTYSGAGAYNNCSIFTATAQNTNSRPTPDNTNWTPATKPLPTPLTVSGTWVMNLPLVTLADASTITLPYIESDPLPFIIPAGGYLAVETFAPLSGSQVIPADGQGQNLALGSTAQVAASVTDVSGSTVYGQVPSSGTSQVRPVLIRGVPITAQRGVVIIGDSISQGKTGGSGFGPSGVSAGGSGYKKGDICTYANSGGTVGAVGAGSNARLIVDNVDGSGAITSFRSIDNGAYADTTTQTGQTRPPSPQALVGGSGTGAVVTTSYSSNAFDVGDTLGAQGWLQRALAAAGIPHTPICASGDRVDLWLGASGTRSRTRMAAIAQAGADIAIIALGRNDCSNGDSATTIQTNLSLLAAALKGVGVLRVIACTITPETTSTTAAGQSTLADQVVTSNNTVRQTVNAWLRGNTNPFDAVIDVAATIEEGGASSPTGKFLPIGGLPAAPDGKHPALSAITLMQAALTPVLSIITGA